MIARLLVEKGADIEAKDNYRWTALQGAAEKGNEVVARLLVEKGADIENEGFRWTDGAAYGSRVGNEAVARLLVENGANIEATTSDGRTALQVAVEKGNETKCRKTILAVKWQFLETEVKRMIEDIARHRQVFL